MFKLMAGSQSISECFQWFQNLDFSASSFLPKYFDTMSVWAKACIAFEELIQSRGLDGATSLFQDDGESEEQNGAYLGNADSAQVCRTLVLVSDASRVGSIIRLRSYAAKMNGEVNLQNCSILEAAKAAIAVPMESTEVKFDGRSHISASVAGYGNPSREVFDEAMRVWRPASLKVLVSLGSGVKNAVSKGGKFFKWPAVDFISYMTNVVTDTERVAEETYRDARSAQIDYYRITGPTSLATIHRCDWSQLSRERIIRATRSYTSVGDTESSIVSCSQSCIVRSADEHIRQSAPDIDQYLVQEEICTTSVSAIEPSTMSDDRLSTRSSISIVSTSSMSPLFDTQEPSIEKYGMQAKEYKIEKTS